MLKVPFSLPDVEVERMVIFQSDARRPRLRRGVRMPAEEIMDAVRNYDCGWL